MGKGTRCRGNFRLLSLGRRDARRWLRGLLGLLHLLFPGAGLPLDQVYSHFDSLRLSGIDHPYTLQRAFLSPTWTADHVSRLQLSFQAGDLGPMMADVAGLGVVEEWTTVRSHAKHSDRQLYVQPGLWFF